MYITQELSTTDSNLEHLKNVIGVRVLNGRSYMTHRLNTAIDGIATIRRQLKRAFLLSNL